ncbi:MAG: YIP1 family protein [Haloplanus sp.]
MSLRTLLSALVFPDAFFSTRPVRTADAGRVVLLVAALHAVGYYALLLAGAAVASSQGSSFGVTELLADLGGWTYAQGLLVGLLVVLNWLIVGAVLHIALSLRGDAGPYADTLAVVGWSSPAALLSPLVGGVGFLLAVHGNTLAMSYDAKLAAVAPAATLASVVGGLLTLLWQGHVWSAGLRHVHGVDRRAAAEATALTFVLGVAALVVGA